MVMFPPQPAEPVSAGFNEETGDPVEITVSCMMMKKALINDHDHDHVELEEGTDVDEPVSAGFNEENGDPVEITVS